MASTPSIANREALVTRSPLPEKFQYRRTDSSGKISSSKNTHRASFRRPDVGLRFTHSHAAHSIAVSRSEALTVANRSVGSAGAVR